jgi:non-ribosomal peptide synthetase component E (peptide arylation enzyme)
MTASFVHGLDTDSPLRHETIGRALDAAAEAWGSERGADRPPPGRIRWTYAELKHRVDRLAAGLIGFGPRWPAIASASGPPTAPSGP